MSSGVVYIATGLSFVKEAISSAKSLRVYHPDLPIVLFTDTDLKFCKEVFSEIRRIKNPTRSFADKIEPLIHTPFDETLFLDTDTYLCDAVPEIFEILQHYDIAMAHAPMRQTGSVDVPSSFPEFNSGVIAYRMNDRTRSLLEKWYRFYEEQVTRTGQNDDQPALRRALWNSDAKIAVLPPEYNFRFVLPAFAGRGKVKILHGRHPNFPNLEQSINRSGSPRVFLPRLRDAIPRYFQFISWPGIVFGKLMIPIALLASFFGSAFDGLMARIKSRL